MKDYISTHTESPEILHKKELFAFVDNEKERTILLNQFSSTRTIYKFFEGMQAVNENLDAEAKIQAILFLSLIEYSCDYLIQNQLRNTKATKNESKSGLRKLNIDPNKLNDIAKSVNRDTSELVVSAIDTKMEIDLKRITFNNKLKIIENSITETDKKVKNHKWKIRAKNRHTIFSRIEKLIYYRNNIHISHEINGGRASELPHSKDAYQLIEKFSDMINTFLNRRDVIPTLNRLDKQSGNVEPNFEETD